MEFKKKILNVRSFPTIWGGGINWKGFVEKIGEI